VPLNRVHIFTLIQMACLICLWLIKSFSSTSILFPLMLVVMIGIRKSLDCLFTRRELKILDDIMPEMTKRNHSDDLNHLEGGEVGFYRKFVACCIGTKKRSTNSKMRSVHR
jgi:solute carrier family 4 (sodium bicarbonate transporter), member 10